MLDVGIAGHNQCVGNVAPLPCKLLIVLEAHQHMGRLASLAPWLNARLDMVVLVV